MPADTDPMIDLSLFANRAFAGGTTALMLWAFGLFGIYFFTSLYLQDMLGFSASKAGLAFVPMALLIAAGATIPDRVAHRLGAHRSVGLAMVLMGAGIVSVSLLGRHAAFLDLMPGFAVIGIGGGLTIPLTNTVVSGMPAARAGVASAVFNASREMAGLLGITIIGVIVTARQHAQGRPRLLDVVSLRVPAGADRRRDPGRIRRGQRLVGPPARRSQPGAGRRGARPPRRGRARLT